MGKSNRGKFDVLVFYANMEVAISISISISAICKVNDGFCLGIITGRNRMIFAKELLICHLTYLWLLSY